MRQVLFYIPIQGDWSFGPLGDVPGFGFGIVLLLWLLFGAVSLWKLWRREERFTSEITSAILWWGAIALGIILLPSLVPDHLRRIPVFGYGAMLVAGVVASGWVASRRAPLAGAEPKFAWDMTVWLMLSGVVGSRLFHLIQYRDVVYADTHSLADFIRKSVMLPDGGLVLYGGIILAAIVYFVLCRKHRVDPVKFGDAVVPAVFVGIMCGRIGCFLNGCCYGNACELPWAVSFDQGSVPWTALVNRGFLSPETTQTMPLHPTQLYSSINGLVLALLTVAYYPYRNGKGSVIALAMILYPISRICLEIVRNDEIGQLGTGLTISQLVSLGVLVAGLLLAWWSWTRSRSELPSNASSRGRVSQTA